MDLEITESVVASGNGTAELTLEVTDAEAFGFRAEAEQQEALGRRATFTYNGKGFELSENEESLAFFGTPGSLHMADIALTAHLISPVLPQQDWEETEELTETAVLPSAWSNTVHRLQGATTVGPSEQRRGVQVVSMDSTKRADLEVSLPSLDNAEETILGGEPQLNEFFLATMFQVLVAPGTPPESLLPDFPIQVGDAHIHDHAHRRRRTRRRRKGLGRTLLAGVALAALSACASHPHYAETVTSIRLDGPVQFQQESSLHASSGVLIDLVTQASAELSGTTIQPNDEAREDLGEQLWALTGVDVALIANWSIEQTLVSELPAEAADRSNPSDWAIPAGLVLLAVVAIGVLLRRRPGKDAAEPAGTQEED